MLAAFVMGVLFCVSGILTEKPFDLRFHQNDYSVDFEWAEVARFDNRSVKDFRLVTFKHNRTTTAFNVTQQYNIDLGNELQQAYKFTSNEYRMFPAIRFELNYCFMFNKNIGRTRRCLDCGNFNGCPILKGKRYHTCNFVPDKSRFSPLIPSGRYKMEYQGLFHNVELWLVNAYSKIHRQFDRK